MWVFFFFKPANKKEHKASHFDLTCKKSTFFVSMIVVSNQYFSLTAVPSPF